jgi:pyrimidine operon attenuation protein/uracil phosphoribosyltransferase
MTIAEKIGALLSAYFPTKIIAASMNKSKPDAITLSETVDFNDTNILICDDVANSGKTLLYVLKPLLQSHPKRIQTLVMVERMHKLFPIKPDYVGLSLATTLQEHIYVEVTDGEVVGAYIE